MIGRATFSPQDSMTLRLPSDAASGVALSGAASGFQVSLAKRPTSPGMTADVRKLSELARKVSRELEQLHLHPTDRNVAERLKQPLKDDADAADKLAK